MSHTEFQTESYTQIKPDQDQLRQDVCDLAGEKAQAAIESVLLGLHFRSWLTDSERRLLELLVSPPAALFLARDGRCLGPLEATDLVAERFHNSPVTSSHAIFTDHHQPDTASEIGPSRIHTAIVGEIDGTKLVLGLVEPDRSTPLTIWGDCFAPLVERFRRAMAAAAGAARLVSVPLGGSDPVLVVHRTSGRVLMITQAAADLFRLDVRSLVDLEYSSLAGRLGAFTVDHRLRVENLAFQDIPLSIVSILPKRRQPASFSDDRLFSDFFVHTVRNKIASITTASSHLATLATEDSLSEVNELATMIQREAAELDRHLERWCLLATPDTLPSQAGLVKEALAAAVGRIQERYGFAPEVDGGVSGSSLAAQSPPAAMEHLIEAVLHSQLVPSRPPGITRVSLTEDRPVAYLKVETSSPAVTRRTRVSSPWQSYACRLAETLGFSCSYEKSGTNGVTTVISIPREGK